MMSFKNTIDNDLRDLRISNVRGGGVGGGGDGNGMVGGMH